MNNTIRFGTDGWRGKIAQNYTFDNVRRCSQGFSSFLLATGVKNQSVVVGYDKRFLSDEFALSAAEVTSGNNLKTYLTSMATPTPVISYSVTHKNAAGAINITASHNPPSDNGFKVRNNFGGAIDPDGLQQIESLIPTNVDQVVSTPNKEAFKSGYLEYFDPTQPYLEQIRSLIDLEPIHNSRLRVIVDNMWGNGSGWFPLLLANHTIKVIEIHQERNPIFPEMQRPEPIPPNINAGLEYTVKTKGDVLLILDGDADRVGIGDENGKFVNQLQVFALLTYYFLEVRGERGPIVKTLSTTSMVEKLGKLYQVPVHETGVGFKYVAPKMLETNALIGGEESGGYAFRGHVPERDGILAGLYFLDMMVKLNKKPSQLLDLLFEKIGPHYYDRVDSSFSGDRKAKEQMIKDAKPEKIGGLKITGLNSSDGYKFLLEDGGWMLIRFSGTEPMIRVYCETTRENSVQSILNDGLKIVGQK